MIGRESFRSRFQVRKDVGHTNPVFIVVVMSANRTIDELNSDFFILNTISFLVLNTLSYSFLYDT